MVVNDNAGFQDARVALRSIVGTPPGANSLLQKAAWEPSGFHAAFFVLLQKRRCLR